MFDPGTPNTFWLNFTNIALGLVTLACFIAIGAGVVRELLATRASHATAGDDHAILVPGVGLTMADGGERVEHGEHSEPKGRS